MFCIELELRISEKSILLIIMVKILAAVRIQLHVRLQRGQILGQIYKEGKSALIAASEASSNTNRDGLPVIDVAE